MLNESLAPGFIVASPPLGDPNFDQSVVLLVSHSEDGAFGFVINRATGLRVPDLLGQAGYDGKYEDSSCVWLGGPVQPESAWVLERSADAPTGNLIAVGSGLRVSSSRSAFDRLAKDASKAGGSTSERMVILGYSGWGPSQLEDEVARGAWLPTPLDASILFDVEPEKRWERSYALLGLTPTQMMSMSRGGNA